MTQQSVTQTLRQINRNKEQNFQKNVLYPHVILLSNTGTSEKCEGYDVLNLFASSVNITQGLFLLLFWAEK